MQKLFRFLHTYRAFLTFLVFEVISLFLLVQYNRYQRSAFFNSSSQLVGSALKTSTNVSDYFKLKNINEKLIAENKELKNLLLQQNQKSFSINCDSAKPEIIKQYEIISAKVISNSTNRINNYITIDKGLADGIQPGMSVIGAQGIVGKIKVCSNHFATITSILHTDMMVSCQIKSNNAFGTLKWIGKTSTKAEILYLPKHLSFYKGDTVVTSGYNSVFPPRIFVGIIDRVESSENNPYYDIRIKLGTDFSTLTHVYIVKNNFKKELEEINRKTTDE